MSAILPGANIELEVALGIGQAALGAVWDTATFDYSVWQQSDTSYGDFIDVSCDVADGFTMSAGATNVDGVVTRWEAATVALDLLGNAYDPRSGPWAGILGPSVQVRIRWRVVGSATWLTAFLGFIDDDGLTYDPKAKRAHLAATDGTRIFNAYDGLEQSPIGLGETAAQRVGRIADLVGWPSARRDITAGGVTVQATTLADNAWTMLLAVADTDLALLWINRAGALAYRPQGKVSPSQTVNAMITCGTAPAGVTRVRPLNIEGQQSHTTRNIVSVARQSDGVSTPATVTLRDDTSVVRYYPHTYERTDLIHTDDAWSTTVASAILLVGAFPTTCPDTATLDTRADIGAGPLLLGLEPNVSITVEDLDGGVWQCEPAGWSVTVSRAGIHGDIRLLDVSQWFGSPWDGTAWDDGRWGF